MNEIIRLLALLAIFSAIIALTAAIIRGYNRPAQRLRRGLAIVLQDGVHGVVAAHNNERGVGFDFNSHLVAVAWDMGGWGLVYSLDELMGAEVIVDGQMAGFAYAGEPRWPRELVGGVRGRVTLRLIFDDPTRPDFVLDLWRSDGKGLRPQRPPAAALHEANHWLGRIESLLNHPRKSWWETPPMEAPRFPAPMMLRTYIESGFRYRGDEADRDAA